MAHIVGGLAVAIVGLIPVALLVEAERYGAAAGVWASSLALIWVYT